MGEGFKFVKGLLVLLTKEDVDGFAVWIYCPHVLKSYLVTI